MIKQFLIFCSGANFSTLKRAGLSSEESMYMSVGMTVLATAVLSAVSGGYLFYIAFISLVGSLFFGSIWGLLIFNLDRLLVASITPMGNVHFLRSIQIITPRLLLSIFLGVVTSKPLELAIFKEEVDVAVSLSVIADRSRDIAFATSRIQQNSDNDISLLKQRISELERSIISETNGQSNTNVSGVGPVALERRKELTQRINELNSLQKKVENEKNAVADQISIAYEKHPDGGLLTQLSALNRLAANNERIALIQSSITGLLVLIQILPLLIKIISPYDLYQYNSERELQLGKYIIDKKIDDSKSELEDIFTDRQSLRSKIREEILEFVNYKISSSLSVLAHNQELNYAFDQAIGQATKKVLEPSTSDSTVYRYDLDVENISAEKSLGSNPILGELIEEVFGQITRQLPVKESGNQLLDVTDLSALNNMTEQLKSYINEALDKRSALDSNEIPSSENKQNSASSFEKDTVLQTGENLGPSLEGHIDSMIIETLSEFTILYNVHLNNKDYAQASNVADVAYRTCKDIAEFLYGKGEDAIYLKLVALSSYWKLNSELYKGFLNGNK